MTYLRNYNDAALDGYLRGEYGELARLEAMQELKERGKRSAAMTEDEMVEHLQSLGYGILSPLDLQAESCPWCGVNGKDLHTAGALATALAELVDVMADDEYTPESALRPYRALLREWKEAR